MRRPSLLALAIALAIAPAAVAGTINVPADYPTIQQAIDAAVNGDLIVVAQGTFVENIKLKGKTLTLKGAGQIGNSGPRKTLIDGSLGGPCVTVANGEGAGTVITGFDLRHGTGKLLSTKRYGGGLYISNFASPTISDCGIGFNSADLGAGIFIDKQCTPVIQDSLIANNVTANKGTGGGIYSKGTATFDNCRIAENSAPNGAGGGMFLEQNDSTISGSQFDKNHALFAGGLNIKGGSPSVTGTLFEENEVLSAPVNGEGGGLYIIAGSTPWVSGNEFRLNLAHTGAGIYSYDSTPAIVANLIHDNTASTSSAGFGIGAGVALGKSKGTLELNEIYDNVG